MARPWLLRLIAEDLGAKVLAVVVALTLWVAVSFLGTRTLIVEDVSVSVLNLRDDLAVAGELPAVDVKVRAPRALLRGRDPKELVRAFVDLSARGIGAQSAEVDISPSDRRVDVIIVVPSRINFTLDPVVQRSLTVAVEPEGTPADGYQVGESTVEPKTVLVRGALRRLQESPAVPVRVSVQGATTTVEGEFPLAPPDGIAVLTEKVRVRLQIVQAEETKTLGVRVLTAGTPAAGYWVRSVATDPAVVTLRGARDWLADRTFVETKAVEIGNARAPVEREAELTLPEGASVQGGEPRVRVKIDVAPLEGSKEVTAAVQVNDVPDGLRVTNVSPGSVRVTVRGSGESFDRLRAEEVRVVLSARGRGGETFAVRPEPGNVRAPSGVQVVSVEGVYVQVTLEGA